MKARRVLSPSQRLLRRIQCAAWRAYGLLITIVFGGGMLVLTSSCTALNAEAQAPGRWLGDQRPVRRIAQVDLDGRSVYGVCAESDCPKVTTKTIEAIESEAPRIAQDVPHAETAAAGIPQPRVGAERVATDAIQSEARPVAVQQTDIRHAIVTFPFGEALMTEQGRASLDDLVVAARNADRIVIAGRTDSVGGQAVNQRLALARAMAVRNYLRERAPRADTHISLDVRAKCCYAASNQSAAGRARNRRAEVLITVNAGPLAQHLIGHPVPVNEGPCPRSLNPDQPVLE